MFLPRTYDLSTCASCGPSLNMRAPCGIPHLRPRYTTTSNKSSAVQPRSCYLLCPIMILLRSVYVCFVRPVLEYACPLWHSSLTSSLHDDLEQIQRRATKIMLPSLSYNERLSELGLPTLHERRVELCRRFYKSVVRQHKFHDVLPSTVERPYSLRNSRTFSLVKCRTKRFQDSLIPYAVKSWDASP